MGPCILKSITKNIQYLFLLWLFVHPTAVQFLHHHNDEGVFHRYADNTLHSPHSKCAVCDFHFPVFSDQLHSIHNQKCAISFEQLIMGCFEPSITSIPHVAFLRGPPSNGNFTFTI